MNIETTSITGYTVGTPYSFTLLASGGSGMYNWSIDSGVLPGGLSLNGDTGVISGTPNGVLATNPIVFRLIDTACELAVKTLQTPLITMSTRSTTQIATVLGYDEFITSTPPKRYHTASWNGTSEQQLFVNDVQIGGAKYDYSGFDHINSSGNVDSTHSKIYSAQCDNNLAYFNIQGNDIFLGSVLFSFKGYYGMSVLIPGLLGSPEFMCPSSSIPYAVIGDQAVNGTFDKSDLWGSEIRNGSANLGITKFLVQDSVTKTCDDTGSSAVSVLPYLPTFQVGINLLARALDYFTPGIINYINSYSCILSDEYTDAEALANARVIQGNSNVAQNNPRTTGFISTFTNVVFTLITTNLVSSQRYLVSVDFVDITAGTMTTRQYGFQADDTGKHNITDVIPTPAVGHSIVVRNPRIAFVT
jgi:hypothetical protein